MKLKLYKKALMALVGVLMLSGCESALVTEINVESATEASVVASVEFYDEAAEAVRVDPSLATEIKTVLKNKTGQEVKEKSTDGFVQYTSNMPYAKLAESASITGVESALLSTKENDVTLTVNLVEPGDLQQAIIQGNASEEDAEALVTTIFRTTTINVKVTYPGNISEATGPGTIVTDKNTTSLKLPLADFSNQETLTFHVVGSTEAPFWTKNKIILASGITGVLAVTSLLLYARHRRNYEYVYEDEETE